MGFFKDAKYTILDIKFAEVEMVKKTPRSHKRAQQNSTLDCHKNRNICMPFNLFNGKALEVKAIHEMSYTRHFKKYSSLHMKEIKKTDCKKHLHFVTFMRLRGRKL